MKTNYFLRTILCLFFIVLAYHLLPSQAHAEEGTVLFSETLDNCSTEPSSESTLTENSSSSGSVTVQLSITILPVRFVYIDSNGAIEKIWSNVKPDDCQYVVRYISSSLEAPIDSHDTLREKYAESLVVANTSAEGIIYENNSSYITSQESIEASPKIYLDTASDCDFSDAESIPAKIDEYIVPVPQISDQTLSWELISSTNR